MTIRFGVARLTVMGLAAAISCGVTAKAQDAGSINDSKAIAVDSAGRPTTSDRPLAVAAVSPASTNLGGPPVGAPKPWLAVVIQATLVEMGCEHVAISGHWDAATQNAATRALSLASYETSVAATPSDDLLLALRAIRGRACGVASVGQEGRLKPDLSDEAPGATVAKTDSVVKIPNADPPMKLGGEPRNGMKKSVQATARSDPPRRSPGPAVFVRPVGVGNF